MDATNALSGKVVVITGSTRGIGRAMAEACARADATVVVSSRTASAVDATVAAITAAGGKATGIVCDVAREEDLEALLRHAVDTHGRVDVWVNNAGISLGMRYHTEESVEEIHRIVDVNLMGVMLASRLVVPYFVENGGGVLINVSGRGGRGDPAPYTAAYAATKAGVMSFTRSIAGEHEGEPVSIHVFMPGMVDTDFYGTDMIVSPGLAERADNIRIVLDTIGTPIEQVGPKLVEVAAQKPGVKTGELYTVNGPLHYMVGGLKMAVARMTGRMKPM